MMNSRFMAHIQSNRKKKTEEDSKSNSIIDPRRCLWLCQHFTVIRVVVPSALQRRRWINNCCNSDRHFTLSLHLCYHLSPESSMSRVEKCQLAYGMNVPKANGTRPLCAQHLARYCPTATQRNVYYIFLVLFIFWLFVCCFYFFLVAATAVALTICFILYDIDVV